MELLRRRCPDPGWPPSHFHALPRYYCRLRFVTYNVSVKRDVFFAILWSLLLLLLLEAPQYFLSNCKQNAKGFLVISLVTLSPLYTLPAFWRMRRYIGASSGR